MKEIAVVFNSLVNATGAVKSDLTYQFDWSILDEGAYQVSFVYHGLTNKKGNKVPLLYVDLGSSSTTYSTSATNYANSTLFLGTLFASEVISGDTQYLSSHEQNEPKIIKTRPMNQSPRIFVRNMDGTPFTDAIGADLADYVLTLHLKKID
jgi:hypothetical protein